MQQLSFSEVEYGLRRRTTKREEFLKIMDEIIPGDELVAYVEPHYPKGQRGRPPLGIEKMLSRMRRENATSRCVRPRKETNGILG